MLNVQSINTVVKVEVEIDLPLVSYLANLAEGRFEDEFPQGPK